jgi:hypothetical protein
MSDHQECEALLKRAAAHSSMLWAKAPETLAALVRIAQERAGVAASAAGEPRQLRLRPFTETKLDHAWRRRTGTARLTTICRSIVGWVEFFTRPNNHVASKSKPRMARRGRRSFSRATSAKPRRRAPRHGGFTVCICFRETPRIVTLAPPLQPCFTCGPNLGGRRLSRPRCYLGKNVHRASRGARRIVSQLDCGGFDFRDRSFSSCSCNLVSAQFVWHEEELCARSKPHVVAPPCAQFRIDERRHVQRRECAKLITCRTDIPLLPFDRWEHAAKLCQPASRLVSVSAEHRRIASCSSSS